MNKKPFIEKINEIKSRMNYIIDNWESDSQITHQEIRFTIVACLHDLYRNKKVKDLVKVYLQRIEKKERLDSESLLTAIASSLVVHKDFSEYWIKLKTRINKSSNTEKYNLIIQFLIILTPNIFKKFKDEKYIKKLIDELKNQDTEKKLFSYWTEKRLFSMGEEITIPQDQIKHLKEYLLWEIANSEEYDHQKEELREKFIPEMLNYKVDRVDWVVLLIYQFLKKNKPVTVTQMELNRKIRLEIKSAISKKVWFPLGCSMMFVLLKLYPVDTIGLKAFLINWKTSTQTFLLFTGALFLFFEEKLPSFEIPVKRYRITFGQIGELLMIISVLWAANLTPIIKEMIPW